MQFSSSDLGSHSYREEEKWCEYLLIIVEDYLIIILQKHFFHGN